MKTMDMIDFLGRAIIIRSFPLLGPGGNADAHHPHYFCYSITLYHHENGEIKLETRHGVFKERALTLFECEHIWKSLKKIRLPQKIRREGMYACEPDCHHEIHIIFDDNFLKFHWTDSDENREMLPYQSLRKLEELLFKIEPFDPSEVFENFHFWE